MLFCFSWSAIFFGYTLGREEMSMPGCPRNAPSTALARPTGGDPAGKLYPISSGCYG